MCAGKHQRVQREPGWTLAGVGETFGRVCDFDFTFTLCDSQVNEAQHLPNETQRMLLLDSIRNFE
jgi:hypothetical protein